MNRKDKYVVITAPHALCYQNIADDLNHSCDYVSAQCAQDIYDMMTCNKKLFLSDERRSKHDMNRIESRGTNFRKKIAESFKDARMLLDIHSYPRMKSYPFKFDSYVIDDENPPTNLSRRICKVISDEGFTCEIVRGSGVNDITKQARSNGVPSVLIEICESLDEDDRLLLCKSIADYVCK